METTQVNPVVLKNQLVVLIIGAGPGGLTAAIYLRRAGYKVILIDPLPGGQLNANTMVENFPGFPKGILGFDLMEQMKEQALAVGTEFIQEKVDAVDFSKRPFIVRVGENEILADSVIISTGAKAKYLGLPSEELLIGHGLSTCATCDGFFYHEKNVAVVGGGDTALEYALHLVRLADSVTVIHRRNKFKASDILVKRAEHEPKIQFVFDSKVVELKDHLQGSLKSIIVLNLKTGKKAELAVDGLFLAVGHRPNSDLFKGQLKLTRDGYIKTTAGVDGETIVARILARLRRMLGASGVHTSVAGVFAAGDVQDPLYKQAVVAAGTGCIAALEAQRFLERNAMSFVRAVV